MAPKNSYGSLEVPASDDGKEFQSSEESSPLMEKSKSNNKNGKSTTACGKRIQKRQWWIYSILAVTAVTVGVAVFSSGGKNTAGGSHHTTKGGSGNGAHTKWGTTKKSEKVPASGVLSQETLLDPSELDFITTTRLKAQSPGPAWGDKLIDSSKPLPTNSWYLNMLSRNAGTDHPSEANRVYTVPYIIDTAGPIPGIRVHWPTVKAGVRNMQMVVNSANGLTLGSAAVPSTTKSTPTKIGRKYTLADMDEDEELSMLGVSLQWKGHDGSGDDDDDDNDNAMAEKETSTMMPSTSTSGSGLRKTKGDDDNGDDNEGDTVDNMMTTHLVRGMPYATMVYSGDSISPSITSGGLLASPPLIDGSKKLTCGEMALDEITQRPTKYSSSKTESSMTVEREVLLHFESSDFTWVVFFSKPVQISCYEVPKNDGMVGILPDTMFQLFVTSSNSDDDDGDNNKPLVTRVALVDECTTGKSNVAEHCEEKRRMKGSEDFLDLLRASSGMYPKNPILELDMSTEEKKEEARYAFDWDVRSFKNSSDDASETRRTKEDEGDVTVEGLDGVDSNDGTMKEDEVLMFALPHHQKMLESIDGVSSNKVLTDYCKPTFHGSTCLVRGNKWSLVEKLGERQSFIADRPPEASVIPDLAKALAYDIKYELSPNLKIGAADTYFPGKILARMGRVLLISKELQNLKDGVDSDIGSYADDLDEEWYSKSVAAAKKVSLPSEKEFQKALDALKNGIDVWINGKGQAQYLYDDSWGGFVNCGCRYTAKDASGHCSNSFPDCPALTDVNEDFGNGFYNDHHFHYGYNIYAAAVAAKLDPAWGRTMFDRIMLYVRDIANPAPDDPFFPQFRQKDWFLGSSWASGIVSMDTPHGRNQESSSEAIAAYEGVTLFGSAMAEAFKESSEESRAQDAETIRDSGRLLTAMEVSATQRYWHVWNSPTHNNTYPAGYKQPVVGMLYETMASFQTWFDGGDMASIGIQLLPFTPVAERRDDPEWAAIVYPRYKESCMASHEFCVKNGWSVMLCGLKATIGDRDGAVKDVLDIPVQVFKSEGGDGHTRSNLLWYVSTRPDVDLKIQDQNETASVAEDDDSVSS